MKKLKYKVLCFLVFTFFGFLVTSTVPVTEASANIILKVMSANPSKEQSQKVTIKAYLPKEIKPESIVDKGDLEVGYDSQQGSHYVYGEYELKPGEVVEKDVEIRDIFNIPSTEIEALRAETEKTAGMLKNSEFADRAVFLQNSVESKLNQVVENQKAPPANPERHISDYRDNLRTIESAKADIALMRSLLSQAKPFPTAVIWKVIVAIIAFLGLLGTVFFIIWQKQVKVITHDTFYVPKEDVEMPGSKPVTHKEEEEDKKAMPDIDKIIEKEDEA